jgi:tetratricopeptide (TPR) repeat protein
MKKITLSIITSLALLSSTLHADLWQDTKVFANKATFWKSKHLEDIDFEHIYPKKFYKKSYFGFVVTGVAIAGAGAFTYLTAGAGAPAAATGVGTVATWAGGGGAGAYMAGLSTIGGWFGGNAMLGAAILNGISIGTLGGGATTFAGLSVLAKVGVMASVTAMGLDGVAYFKNPDTKQLEYRIKLMIPKNLGSKDTRDIVDEIYDIEEKLEDDYSDNRGINSQKLLNNKKELEDKAIELLKNKLYTKDNQEDLIVLAIIASNNAEYSLFDKAIKIIDSSKLDNSSFLNYLKALNSLYKGEEGKSLEYLDSSISENPYALEPIILSINLLGNSNFLQNEIKIKDLAKNAEENFDSDDYSTSYSLSGVYYRVATFYFNNERYASAQEYYEKAYDELGMLQKNFFGKELGNTIQLGIANSLYKEGKSEKALKVYSEIIEDIDDDNADEKTKIKEQYLGNK